MGIILKIIDLRDKYLPSMGGTELYIDQIGRYMVRNGHNVNVLTTTMGYYNAPYNIVRLQFNPLIHRFVERQKSLLYYRWLLKESFDILHLHTFSPRFHIFNLISYPIFNIAKLKKAKVVFTLHGSKQLYWYMWDQIKTEIRKSNFVIFVDYHMLKYVKELGIKNFSYIPTPINTSIFHPMLKNEKLLEFYNLYNKFVILSISRLEQDRNVIELLEMARKLKGYSDIIFMIIGSGSLGNYYKSLTKKWGCKNIIFVGKIFNLYIPEYLSIADVLVNPINVGGIGRAALEAMACGKPVLRKVIEDDHPHLKDEINFIRYTKNNFITKLLLIKNDEELMLKIGENARSFVVDHASTDLVGKRIESIYQRLLL